MQHFQYIRIWYVESDNEDRLSIQFFSLVELTWSKTEYIISAVSFDSSCCDWAFTHIVAEKRHNLWPLLLFSVACAAIILVEFDKLAKIVIRIMKKETR